mgnify:CR=1 FL=1
MNDPNDAATRMDGEPVETDDSGEGAQATDSSGTQLTPEAFKGLQRNLSAKDRQIQELQAQIARASNQTQGIPEEQLAAFLRPLLTQLSELDPDAAKRAAENVRATFLAYQNQQLKSRDQQSEQARLRQEAEDRAVAQLRGIAEDLGADPDSPMLGYGDDSMWLQDRIALVRESAKKATAPAKPKAAPKASASEGTAHNANPGVPPSTTPRGPAPVTKAAYDEALADYARSPSPTKMAKLQEMRDALRAQAAL